MEAIMLTISFARCSAACLMLATVAAACSSPASPTLPTGPSGSLYVVNLTGNITGPHVTVYAGGDTGNVAPTTTIAGTKTGLHFPTGIARDSSGQLFVLNLVTATGPESVTVYGSHDTWNAMPTRAIAGTNTGLHNPQGLAADAAGQLYVANVRDGGTHGDSITVYAADANGNAAPRYTIAGSSTGLNCPWGLAVDHAGRLYVANACGNSITEYAPGANGNAVPVATIAGGNTGLSSPQSIALDITGQLYVLNDTIFSNQQHYSITVYAANATGDVAPVRAIAGTNAGLQVPMGLAIDNAQRLYVADDGSSSIAIFAPGASGNVPPIATIAGSNTGLSGPQSITF
jgi:secreted PhoX family phosphatase